MKKQIPKFKTEKEFTKWFENSDLADYVEPADLAPVNFELKKKDKTISLRLSSSLLNLLKKAAGKHNIKYQKLIRSIIEDNIGRYL